MLPASIDVLIKELFDILTSKGIGLLVVMILFVVLRETLSGGDWRSKIKSIISGMVVMLLISALVFSASQFIWAKISPKTAFDNILNGGFKTTATNEGSQR